MSTPFVGEIRIVGFNFAPVGWAICDGSLMSIAQNPTLYDLIGTVYGGDGQNTFGLPDLRGRIPVHQGGSAVLGQLAGTETVTLTSNQIPAHSHQPLAQSGGGNQPGPGGGLWASYTLSSYTANAPTGAMNAASIGTTGGGQPHDNIMPSVVVNFVIALSGIFPIRS